MDARLIPGRKPPGTPSYPAPEDYSEALVREAGCTDPQVLLGWRPGKGPRCRLCSTEAAIPTAVAWELLQAWAGDRPQ